MGMMCYFVARLWKPFCSIQYSPVVLHFYSIEMQRYTVYRSKPLSNCLILVRIARNNITVQRNGRARTEKSQPSGFPLKGISVFVPIFTSIRSLFGLERKSGTASPEAWLFDAFGARPTSAGVVVTPRHAMECAPVHCAVQSISEAIGQLPVHVYKRGSGDAKERDPNHPAFALLHDAANEWTPAATFREQITRDARLYPHGGFAFINRVDGGKPAELIRIDPEASPVSVTYEDSEPVYKIGSDTIDRQNILHIPS